MSRSLHSRAFRIGAALSLITFDAAAAQTCAHGIPGGRTLESERYVIAYRTAPSPIPMGRHFTLDFVVCARGGAAEPETVRVDAYMPEHRHGMNYKALVKPMQRGRYHAEGLMFHMPGRWELQFDVGNAGASVRLTDTLLLK